MYAELIPVVEKSGHYKGDNLGYFLIEETEIPDLYPEFDPGPKDGKEAMFYNKRVDVFFVQTFTNEKPLISEVGWLFMKEYYSKIQGRNERIYFWQVMKHLEEMDVLEEIDI